jgi:hypothetical protein
MQPKDDEPLTQELNVPGMCWLLADDDLNCSRWPLASSHDLVPPTSLGHHQLQPPCSWAKAMLAYYSWTSC